MRYPQNCPENIILKIMFLCDKWIQMLLKGVAIINLVTVISIVFIQIVCRSVLGFSFRWVDEFARWTNIYAAMCGGALCYRYRGLTGFSAVVDRLSKRKQIIIQYINDVIISAFSICALVGAIRVLDVVNKYGQRSSVTRMPMAIPYFIIVLAFGSILVFSINMIVFGLCKVNDRTESGENSPMGVIQ